MSRLVWSQLGGGWTWIGHHAELIFPCVARAHAAAVIVPSPFQPVTLTLQLSYSPRRQPRGCSPCHPSLQPP